MNSIEKVALRDFALTQMLQPTASFIETQTRALIDANAEITMNLEGFVYRGEYWKLPGVQPARLKRLAHELHGRADEICNIKIMYKETLEYANSIYNHILRDKKTVQQVRDVFPDHINWPASSAAWGLTRVDPLPYAGATQPSEPPSLYEKLYMEAQKKIRYCNGSVLLLGNL